MSLIYLPQFCSSLLSPQSSSLSHRQLAWMVSPFLHWNSELYGANNAYMNIMLNTYGEFQLKWSKLDQDIPFYLELTFLITSSACPSARIWKPRVSTIPRIPFAFINWAPWRNSYSTWIIGTICRISHILNWKLQQTIETYCLIIRFGTALTNKTFVE